MKNALLTLFTAVLTLSVPASAADKAAPALPGHYYLQGVTEVGSELLLKDNGKFEWMLSYGNADQQASGDWRVAGDALTLVSASDGKDLQFRLFTDAELRVKKPPEAGTWIALVGVPDMGPVDGVEVQFEAKSGKTMTAISLRNGDAIVRMPASEQWVRTGLRRQGSKEAFQWLAVPAARASARIAGFAITNPEAIAGPAFKELELKVVDGGLRVADPDSGLARGLYAK